MKTRCWKVEFIIHDTPEYDDHGVPEPHCLKSEHIKMIEGMDFPAGVEMKNLKIKMTGHFKK